MNVPKLLGKLILTCLYLAPSVLCARAAGAQREPNPDACGAACGSFLFIIIAIAVLNIALLVWVAKDSKNRGMGSSVGWIFLIMFTGIIGWIIYLFSRPGGELIYCDTCKNKRLKVANVCPHCGNPAVSVAPKSIVPKPGPFCPKCGHKVLPNSAFCEECGKKLISS